MTISSNCIFDEIQVAPGPSVCRPLGPIGVEALALLSGEVNAFEVNGAPASNGSGTWPRRRRAHAHPGRPPASSAVLVTQPSGARARARTNERLMIAQYTLGSTRPGAAELGTLEGEG
jgi:hypothetical protein